MNKTDVLSSLQNNREQLLKAVEGLSPEEMTQPGALGEWSIKDILAHLSRWEAELIRILFEIQQGSKPKFPDYTTADLDRMNAQFVQESRSRTLEQVMTDFRAIRKQTIKRIEQFSEGDLTDPKRYPFLGGASLVQFIAVYTYDHDAEHTEQIHAWRKQSVQ